MTTIQLKLKDRQYSILIGQSLLKHVGTHLRKLSIGKDAIVISHSSIERLYGKDLSKSLTQAGYSVRFFNVPEGEGSKSASYALKLIEEIASYDVHRNIFILALGGGVIGDLAGFVAAIYKRGIPYIQVPTTLLAQIDSSIGGKTAIDLKQGKNLVGAFYQPRAVLSDISVLKTLSGRQIRNALAEAIKYGVIKDPALFMFLEKNFNLLLKSDPKALAFVIKRCAQIKSNIVMTDEFETLGIRTILNFGHTVGHAIEAAGNFKYQHGEAVALGMRVALKISVLKGLMDPSEEDRVNDLITNVGLPKIIKDIPTSTIMSLMQHDKKFIGGRNRFVLATRVGQAKVVENIDPQIILKALKVIF